MSIDEPPGLVLKPAPPPYLEKAMREATARLGEIVGASVLRSVDGNVVLMNAQEKKRRAAIEGLVAHQLSTSMVAEKLGVSQATVRRYMVADRVTDRYEPFPAPDGRLEATPWWWEWTIDAWVATRPGRGAGGGKKRKPVEVEAS